MSRILLAEDDQLLGDAVLCGLRQEGYTTDWVTDGKMAYLAIISTHENFDAVVLDLGLPKMNGLQVLQTVRKKKIVTPVLILTAKDTLQDRIRGLDTGADDYLTKPFELTELCARLRALLRRSKSQATPKLIYGDIVLNPAAHTVTYKNEIKNLSRREFCLLQKFIENVGRVISREQLNQTLYGWDDNIDSNAIEVHIHNLRKIFGNSIIRTIRGVGYIAEEIISDKTKD